MASRSTPWFTLQIPGIAKALVPRLLLFAFHFLYSFGTKNEATVGFVAADEGCIKRVFRTRIQIVKSFAENLNVVVSDIFLRFSFKNRTLQEQFNGMKRKVLHDRATRIIGFYGRSFQDCTQT